MKRVAITLLNQWLKKSDRKPLLLKGARQVGKTHLLKEFGGKEFPHHHYFNFEEDKKLAAIFQADLFPKRILSELSIRSGKQIDLKNDLVIFDEIQECPKALTSLKYFCEEIPELALCSAGSLLGVTLSEESFPVGKVEFLNLYPLTFAEFLKAVDDQISLEIIQSFNKNTDTLPLVAHERLWNQLKEYYFTGGMPAVIKCYIGNKENRLTMIEEVRKTQKQLVESYYKDFAKHAGKTNSMHILSVFETIPMQLAKNRDASVGRFRFKGVIPKKKSFGELQGPIDWLEKAGLVIRIKICNRAEIPLEAFCKYNLFKLFLFDIGLLGCMLGLPAESIFAEDYGITKGYFAENFVAQEFLAAGNSPLYAWVEGNTEIEFLRILHGKVVPVEVKSGQRTQAKSLKQFILQYSPATAIKLSALSLKKNPSQIVQNIPLYLAGYIDNL